MKSFCSTLLFLLGTLSAFCQDVRFRKITSNQGLSHNTVYSIVQDKKGFMWFGTREGLNRYDSYKVKNYYIKGSKLGGSANKISSLLTFKNNLYLGTDNGLYFHDPATDELSAYQGLDNLTILFLNAYKNKIYAGTLNGLYVLERKTAKLISDNTAAKAMCNLSGGRFLLNMGDDLKVIDEGGKVLKQFNSSALAELSKNDFTVFSIYKDQNEQVWVCTNKGLYQFNQDNDRFSRVRFSLSENKEINTVRSVTRNKENTLYIGTENGLYIYNLLTGTSENYTQSFTNDIKKLNDKAVYSTCLSTDGSVWLGTYFGGVNYIPSSNYSFKSLIPSDKGPSLSGKAVSQMMEDEGHRIWIGTEDGGISIYDPETDSFSYINQNSRPYFLDINNVHAIHNDGYGNIWVGTFLGGLHQFNTKTKATTIYLSQPNDPNSLSNDQVYAIYRDSKGVLWVATQSGLNVFDYNTKKFSLFKETVLGKSFIYDITEDKNGDMWFCTRQNGLYRYQQQNDKLIHYSAPSISSNQIISVFKDREHQLWFGTLDGGVCRYNIDKNRFTNFTIKDGLPNNNVYGILEDDGGNMWFSTNRGLSKYDARSKKFTNYDNKLGLPSNQFNFKSFLKANDGTLYFGSINGLSYFSPQQVASKSLRFPLRFTDFQLFNSSVKTGRNSILKQNIDDAPSINLSYSQNVFTIGYTALNYANPGSNRYAYYLEGFERKWNFVGDKNAVSYTNLSPGDYTFHIKIVDVDGTALSDERILKINVSPPFYMSKMAFFFYFLALCFSIWLYAYFVTFLHQKKLEIQLERIEKEKIKELTQNRLDFFTFISHEFKTPLTLIIASIDQFLEETGMELKKSSELAIIKNNASRLFRLIQQLMEFRKIETDHSSIHLTENDIIEFTRSMTYSFQTLAANKGLSLNYHSSQGGFTCFYDADKVEKILFNVLSNAVKNTFIGEINVNVEAKDNEEDKAKIYISISDTGIGMSPKDIKNAFTPFYKAHEQKNAFIEGSGVGLSLVNSLLNYINGEITIQSEPDKGTLVSISFPVIKFLKANGVSGMPESKTHEIKVDEHPRLTYPSHSEEQKTDPTRYKILIVEDNKELLGFLSKHFSKNYSVITASNGHLAFNKILKSAPDVIISDIQMPKMDGIALCNKIKNDNRFNYIPFILLSSNTTEASRMNGLDVGADAYLNKPFNLKEFDLLVMNMIKSRVQLREHVIGIGKFTLDNLPRNNNDQEFLSKLSATLEKNYSNPKITIEEIANSLNMSRTSLHLYLKKLMDKSATELLNEYRLKKALIMLENNLPVGEVAYYCGYSDPNYFSRIFKKYYQKTPNQYKEEKSTPV